MNCLECGRGTTSDIVAHNDPEGPICTDCYKGPTEEEYRKRELAIALRHAPTIRPCRKCYSPHAQGYQCEWCNDLDPSSRKE